MSSFSVIAVFPLLLLVVRGQFVAGFTTTGPIPLPTTTSGPTTTLLPTTTSSPVTTPVPTTTSSPVTTPFPTTTSSPVTTPVPTTTSSPVTTPVPTTTSSPVTTPPPTPIRDWFTTTTPTTINDWFTTTTPTTTPPGVTVLANLNVRLKAPITMNQYEIERALSMGAYRIEQILQNYYNVKGLMITSIRRRPSPTQMFYP